MNERYVGRQPIIDSRAKIGAYDLLYRESGQNAPNSLTAAVIANLLGEFGMETILGKHIGFVRIDGEILQNDLIHTLPKEKIVYTLFPDVEITETLIRKLESLRAEGYVFALNDCIYTDETAERIAPLIPWLSYIKIDPNQSDLKTVERDMGRLRESGVRLIGVKIETNDTYDLCRSMGFDYFQGYFISQPNIIKNTTFLPEQEAILHLWNLLQGESEMSVLVDAFQKNPTISLKLLQFINSAAFSLRNPVSSIEHVLTLMGRDPIARWIMLMLFSEGEGSPYNRAPLLLMVINRTELMSALAELLDPPISKAEKAKAYFVGMLSLIHLLFHMPHREVLAKLNISDEIRQALLEGSGFYGELLDTVRSIELFDTETIENTLRSKGLEYRLIEPLLKQTMDKVNAFETGMEK